MKRLAFVLLAAVVVSMPACSNDNPTNPTGALPLRFTADLRASNEVPAVTNVDKDATGTMTLTVTVTRNSANDITAVQSADFVVSMAGFPAATSLVGAHIHNGPAGQNAGIFINTGLAAGEVSLSTGTGSFNKSPAGVTVEQVQALVANPAGNYFNVHTAANPGGAIRGQLSRVQ